MTANQMTAMPSTAFKGLKPAQAAVMTTEQANALSAQDLAQMQPAVRTVVEDKQTT